MRHKKKWVAALVLAAGALAVYDAWCIPSLPASGRIGDLFIDAAVDGEIAREYLEGRNLPYELASLREELKRQRRAPTVRELERISEIYSPDAATLLFLERLSEAPGARAFRERFKAELRHVREAGIENVALDPPYGLTLLMAPGWFYEENGHETNADYRVQRTLLRRWGVPHRLIGTDQNGSVEENANAIADAVRQLPDGERAYLVSASKSGGEVALALGRLLDPSEVRRVRGWLSIGGVVSGSALADRVLEPDLCWFVRLMLSASGFDMEGLESMRTTLRRSAFQGLAFPRHLEIYSYIPVPLSGQISERGRLGYRLMRDRGPNDGLTLLADEMIPGATPIIAPGVDHFLGSSEEQLVLGAALFRTILRGDEP